MNYNKLFYHNDINKKYTNTYIIFKLLQLQFYYTKAIIKRSSDTDYNLITSSLLLYSSLLLIDGLRSRMCSASRVRRKFSPRAVAWRMVTCSLVIDELHCARCDFIGPAL